MSSPEKLLKNVEKEVKDFSPLFDFQRLLLGNRIDHKKQERLTEKWILPYKEEILSDLSVLRTETDAYFRAQERSEKRAPEADRYPIGYCTKIRDHILSLISRDLLNRDKQGVKALRGFIREGGLIQTAWIIHEPTTAGMSQYFHSIIQCGTAVIDVANDTVDPKQEKIVLHPDAYNGPFENIDSLEQLATTMETYWEMEIYPNTLFPKLAPLYPFIGVHRCTYYGRKYIEIFLRDETLSQHWFSEEKGRGVFAPVEDFYRGPYGEKKIPDEYVEAIAENKYVSKLAKARPDYFQIQPDPAEREMHITQLQGMLESEQQEDFLKHLQEIDTMGRHVTWRETVLARIPV